MTTTPSRQPAGLAMLIGTAALVLTLVGISQMRDVVAPTFLALTLVLTVRPLVTWLNRRGLPKFLGALAGLLVVYLFLAGLILAIAIAVNSLARELPTYSGRFNSLYNTAVEALAGLGLSTTTITEGLQSFDYTSLFGTVTGLLGGIGSSTSLLLSVFMFVAFLAVDLADPAPRRKALNAVRPQLAAALVDFATRVRKYWIVNTVFGFCVALIDMGILLLLGVPLPLTWGILAFVTAYIPNIGFIIGLIPPALMALLARDVNAMLLLVALYLIVNFVASMIIQPKVTGDAVGLNVTTTFVSLLFWSIVIGPLGTILAVPLTLFAKSVLVDADPQTRWLSLFLSNVGTGGRDPSRTNGGDRDHKSGNPPEARGADRA